MLSGYANQRVIFAKVEKEYLDYLRLYKQLNHGSLVGATTFDVFYWRMVYYSKYQDTRRIGPNGA